jgi:hypothetical protein
MEPHDVVFLYMQEFAEIINTSVVIMVIFTFLQMIGFFYFSQSTVGKPNYCQFCFKCTPRAFC